MKIEGFQTNARMATLSVSAEITVHRHLKIADDSSRDYKKEIGADGEVSWVVDKEHIARCRRRIKTRKRILA